MVCRARVRDITALFNLPKKVAAGTGGAAVELEQQLQKAQQLAQKEHQRAAELEVQLQVGAAWGTAEPPCAAQGSRSINLLNLRCQQQANSTTPGMHVD